MHALSRRVPTRLAPLAALVALACLPAGAQQTPAASSGDAIARIRDEGLNHSQVMQTLSYLTDVIGPRLTGSPSAKRANEWTRDTLAKWGLQNAHLEPWGPFGRGWELERFSAQVVEPQDIPVIAYPKAWSPGWKGVKTCDVVLMDARTVADLDKFKGKLRGAIVLDGPERPVVAHFEPLGTRYTDKQLEEMASAEPRQPGQRRPRRQFQASSEMRARFELLQKKMQFYVDEGVACVVDASPRGDGGAIFVQSASVPPPPPKPGQAEQAGGFGLARVSPWAPDAPKTVPQIVMAVEHYNRLVRMIGQGEKPKMAVELDVKFFDKDPMAYNTVAEIPGSDLKDQIVMLGGHMDSWHSATGATDNGAGVAVCMEAVRILKALNLQPRRTIRIALWTGEEEGLYGSRAYVKEHFGAYPPGATGSRGGGGFGGPAPDPATLEKKPEYDKLSGYFNLDNGTGKIRGVYLQGNAAVRPIFEQWLAPFNDLGAKTLTINNTGSTDHVSFDGIGLPGFQFIQDEIEYETRTHHSNQDLFDHAQADDLKQAATIMAAFVYDAAMRDEMLPRKAPTAAAAR